MVKISKSEKDAIVKRFPDVQTTRTMRQDSKRHHYYMVEAPGPMRMLKKLRGQDERVGSRRRDGSQGGRQNGNRQ